MCLRAGNVVGGMDVEAQKLYLQNIEEYVIDEDKIVSYLLALVFYPVVHM
jgi:hypothetical protein